MEVTKIIDLFIEANNVTAKRLLEEQGGLHPMLVVLGIDNKLEADMQHYTLPLPEFESERAKNFIANIIIPSLLQKAERQGIEILCVCFIMDSWFTDHKFDNTISKEDAFNAARKERAEGKVQKQSMLLCSYETGLVTKSFRFAYETIGENIVWGETHTDGELTGRFANLWKAPVHN